MKEKAGLDLILRRFVGSDGIRKALHLPEKSETEGMSTNFELDLKVILLTPQGILGTVVLQRTRKL